MSGKLKKGSIYLLMMVLIAAVIFSLNYFYASRISEDIEENIRTFAIEEDYQIRELQISANPFLRTVNIERLNFLETDNFSLELSNLEIKLSWQQLINYIQEGDFNLYRNTQLLIDDIIYSNLSDDYQLNFKESKINYQGSSDFDKFIESKNIYEADHDFDFRAAELKVDYPYYRRYGITKDSWDKLPLFDNFVLKVNYDSQSDELIIEEFDLSGEFLSCQADLEAVVIDIDEQQALETDYSLITADSKKAFSDFKANYYFAFDGSGLEILENEYFKDIKLDSLSFDGYFDLSLDEPEEMSYHANQLNLILELKDLKLLFSEELSQQINQNTFGILASDQLFSIEINLFNYLQDFTHPRGSTESNLESPFADAQLIADFNYSQETPYLTNGQLRFRPKKDSAQQLILFSQLIFNREFEEDEAGYYIIEAWGDFDDLQFD
ncbi:hypothetical protein [Halanaerobium hydrogeniformans]|uniref:Uncharacterized protein n=1 Tax=Halanaerobium hydrogeniformans TaxID=656519 RepID=E4RMQ0_HALHG|nr:hypothetical protein [Halanaerobium hydrogeniformans]ADQ14581.1 hypothetical protein Halsa_1149 [Halanaerobium hydrogeniformans]